MGSKSLLSLLWLLGTVVAATIAWQSLQLVSASTDGSAAPASPGPSAGPTDTADSTSTTGSTNTDSANTTDSAESNTAPGDSSDVTATASSSSTTVPGSGSETEPVEQTFDLVGGRTAISFSPDRIEVLWATPAPGYSGEHHAEGSGVEVEFRNGERRSKIEAWWDDGPRFEKRERDD